MNTKLTYLIFLLLITSDLFALSPQKGFIIEIEETSVYLDYTSKDVKIGDRLQVVSAQKIMVHPVTKEKIVKEGEVIAVLEITDVQSNYSVAGRVYPANAFSKLTVGTKVSKPSEAIEVKALPNDGKLNVAIASATVNDMVGPGYLGNYVSDMLMSELLGCDKIRLIDRSVLNAQIDETDLQNSGYIKKDNSIVKGQIAGVQYLIQVTMQKPDVTNVSTGIPFKSMIYAAGAIAGLAGAPSGLSSGLNTSGSLTSNMKTAKLKSAVSITARVVDVQTGEILFMCSGTGNAQGESQVELEGGALGGLQLNGGVEGFKQTVTGKAVALAYRKIGNNLKSFFGGTLTEKVVDESGLHSEIMYRKGSIYQGVNKLSKSDIKEVYSENPELYFSYKKGKSQKNLGNVIMGIGIGGGCLSALLVGSSILYSYNESLSAYTSMLLTSALIGTGGYLLHKSGVLKMKKGINDFNQSLHKTSQNIEWDFGIAPQGLAFAIKY